MTERPAFQLILERRDEHLNDHGLASGYASMITVVGSEPGPGCLDQDAAIRAGHADGGGGSQGEHLIAWATAAQVPAVTWPSSWLGE